MIVDEAKPGDTPELASIGAASGADVDFSAELAREWSNVWVARERSSGPPIAFLVVWMVADEIHVIDLATAPRARRRGAARLLVEHAIRRGSALGARVVLLEVRASNAPAIALYSSMQFEASRVRPEYYSEPTEDALEMMLPLGIEPTPGVSFRDQKPKAPEDQACTDSQPNANT